MEPGGSEPTGIPDAGTRLPVIFRALDGITTRILEIVPKSRNPEDNPEFIRLKIFERSFNALKALRLLLANDHWEFAASVARQMYELLLNLEELGRSEDEEEAASRFMRFAAVQDIRHQVASLRYDISTGRREPEEPPTPEDLEQFALTSFPDLVSMKSGKIRWPMSWSDASIKALARRSGSMRLWQYETLFSLLSSEAHGAPLAAVGGIEDLSSDAPPSVDARIRKEDQRIKEIASLAVAFFLEIWLGCHPPIAAMPPRVREDLDTLASALQEA